MKRMASSTRKNRRRPSNLHEQVDPLMCQAYDDARQEANKIWPTPRARESGDYQYSRGDHNSPTPTLSGAVKMFATPQSRDFRSGQASRWQDEKRSRNLNDQIAMFPTATTGAGLCGGSGNYKKLQSLADEGFISEEERRSMAQGNGGQLNPDWVEWLMGFPTGWTTADIDIMHPLPPKDGEWWPNEPEGVPRVTAKMPNRADRLKCLGNAVVPRQFYPIFKAIADITEDLYDI